MNRLNKGNYQADSQIYYEKVLTFLKCLYFGNVDDVLLAACRHAYMDICRTIRYKDIDSIPVRKMGDEFIIRSIEQMFTDVPTSFAQYTDWHSHTCHELVERFWAMNVPLSIGQAQKWINMTMKYLYVLKPESMEQIYPFLHIPLDNYILNIAKCQYGIQPPKKAWSRIECYENYLEYEKNLMDVINEVPLEWEFRKWVEEASRQKEMNQKE